MIHYHGGPITPTAAAVELWTHRHACVSFAHPAQVTLAAEVCQTFILDNGAYSAWTQGTAFDFDGYVEWVREWEHHPAFDWCLVPDVIDGTEEDNALMLARWFKVGMRHGVPVWHMHESLDRLRQLSYAYPRIALGSSGQYATVGNSEWWQRMDEAMATVCEGNGRPRCKLHGLRMLSPTVFSHLPLASADSTNVARNIGLDKRWTGSYQPVTPMMRALVLAERIEHHVSAARWSGRHGVQANFELIG